MQSYVNYTAIRQKSFFWFLVYIVCSVWLSFVFWKNPLSVHGLPFFEYDRPTSYLYSHADYDLNSISLIRTPVLFYILDRKQPANGLTFRPLGAWIDTPNEMRRIDIEMAINPDDPRPYQVYKSIFGLQSALWGHFARILNLDPENFEETIRLTSCILSGLTIAAVLVWFGTVLHWACIPFGLVLSPMVVGLVLPAPNMYHVLWAAVLPLAVSAWTFRSHPIVHFGAVGAALQFFFLCATTFVSNIAGATAIPAVYFGLLAGHRWPIIARDVLKYVLVAMVAFGIAYVLIALRIEGYTGSDGSGFTHLLGRAESWLVSTTLADGSKAAGFLDGLLKIGGTTGLTLYGPVALPNALVVLLGLGLMTWILTRPTPTSPIGAKLRAWTWTTVFALLVSVSWIILQFHHAALHPRYAPFLLAYPWLLCLVGVLGLLWAARRKVAGVRV